MWHSRSWFRELRFEYVLGERDEMERLARGAVTGSAFERIGGREAARIVDGRAHQLLPELRGLLARQGLDVSRYDDADVRRVARAELESLVGRLVLMRRPRSRVPTLHTPSTPARPVQDAPLTSWIEVELVDDEGTPVPNARYEIRTEDGRVRRGTTGADGLVRVAGIAPGSCSVSFPDIDADGWERA